jgi:hypothetical protein
VKTDFPICCFENAPYRLDIRGLLAPLDAKNSRVGAVNQLAHAGKAQVFACSPIFQLHAEFVRQTHTDVNAAVTGGAHQ